MYVVNSLDLSSLLIAEGSIIEMKIAKCVTILKAYGSPNISLTSSFPSMTLPTRLNEEWIIGPILLDKTEAIKTRNGCSLSSFNFCEMEFRTS